MELIRTYSWFVALFGLLLVAVGAGGWFVYGTLDGNPLWFMVAGGVTLVAYAALD